MTVAANIMREAVPEIVLTLPRPPSANEIWAPAHDRSTGRLRMVTTYAYRQWKQVAGLMVNTQTGGDTLPASYCMSVHVPPGVDVDNLLKPTGDILQMCGVVKNDRFCESIVVTRDRSLDPDKIRVALWSLA